MSFLTNITAVTGTGDVLDDFAPNASDGEMIAALDNLGTGPDPTQTTATLQPILNSASEFSHIDFDGIDDFFNWTPDAPITDGVIVVATKNGIWSGTIDLSAAAELSAMGFTTAHNYVDEDLVGVFVGPSSITAAQKAKVIAEFVKQGAVESFSGVTTFLNRFRDMAIKTFDVVNSSNVTNFSTAWYQNTNLTSFPLIDTSSGTIFSYAFYGNDFASFPLIDTSSGKTFKFTWRDCSSLVEFPANFFDSWSPASVTNECFDKTWTLTPSLSSTSVQNILVSIDTSGIHGTATGLVGGGALLDTEIDIDYDGSGLTGATTTAITSLKTKSWGVSINGVLQ